MAYFPNTIPSFTTKIDIYDVVFASHVNSIQNEVIALATTMGTNSHVSPGTNAAAFVAGSNTWGNIGERLYNLENGVVGDSHAQYVKTTGGSTITPSAVGLVGLNVKAKVGQTANIIEVRDESNVVVFSVSANGTVSIGGVAVALPSDFESLKGAFFLGGDLN